MGDCLIEVLLNKGPAQLEASGPERARIPAMGAAASCLDRTHASACQALQYAVHRLQPVRPPPIHPLLGSGELTGQPGPGRRSGQRAMPEKGQVHWLDSGGEAWTKRFESVSFNPSFRD